MFKIYSLEAQDDGSWISSETEYGELTKDEAWKIVTELTMDAIDSESVEYRWTILPIRSH